MALCSLADLLRDARAGSYAVGYFESWNLESTRAVVDAAEESGSPVVIGFNGGILSDRKRVLGSADPAIYVELWRRFAQRASVPISLLVNEIPSVQMALAAIELGASSLMMESESDDLDSAISLVRTVVKAGHAAGAAVEANVGHLPSAQDGDYQRTGFSGSLTRVDEAVRFVEETGVDALGVSVGNVEVLKEATARLDLTLLGKIHEAVSVPLVLHGGSGIPDGMVPELVARGVSKVNLGAALNTAFLAGMMSALDEDPVSLSPKYTIGSGWDIDCLAKGELAMRELVKRKMSIYGSAGRVRVSIRPEENRHAR